MATAVFQVRSMAVCVVFECLAALCLAAVWISFIWCGGGDYWKYCQMFCCSLHGVYVGVQSLCVDLCVVLCIVTAESSGLFFLYLCVMLVRR